MVDEEMSPEEVAAMFGEPVPVEKAPEYPEEQIYAVSARIKNAATLAVNNNLTPVGVSLCNHYTHTILALYAFANSLTESDKTRMKELIQKQELMPAEFIGGIQAVAPPQHTPFNTIVSSPVTPEDLDSSHTDLDQEPSAKFSDSEEVEMLLHMIKMSIPAPLGHQLRGMGVLRNPNPAQPPFWDSDATPEPKKGLWKSLVEWFVTKLS